MTVRPWVAVAVVTLTGAAGCGDPEPSPAIELTPQGVARVVADHLDEDVIAHYSGVAIDGDPRELDLGISLDEMADIVTDQRLTSG